MNRRNFIKTIILSVVGLTSAILIETNKIRVVNVSKIFEPIELNNLKLKNRLVRSATWEGIAKPDGSIENNMYQIYDEVSKGGIGLIITSFASVSDNDKDFGDIMRLSNDSLIPQYKKLTDIVHKNNCAIIAQIALGKYNKNGVQIEPDDMSVDDIKKVINEFVNAAKRAELAGFDGVQIHAAHFFFLSRFISPLVNHRMDNYGGNPENRSRILIEIIQGIRKIAPNLHITTKINSSDFQYGGLDENESLEICKILSEYGIDSIEVSGNGTSVTGIRPHKNEGYFVPFAKKLADIVKTPVIVVGGLRSKDTMESILNTTNIKLLSFARPLLREPDLPNKFFNNESEVSKCVSCNACYNSFEHRCPIRQKELQK